MKSAITACALFIFLTLGEACDNEASPKCKVRVMRLKQNLIAYDNAAGSLDGYGTDMELPISDIPPQGFRPKSLMLAFYENGRTFLDGIELVSTRTERSTTIKQRISRKVASGDLQLQLFIEKELAVAPLLNALPDVAKQANLALAVVPLSAPRPPTVPPGAAEYERRRQHVGPNDWVKLLTTEFHKHALPCRPLFGALSFSVAQPTEKSKHLIAKATDALIECGCHVADIDALEYTLLAMVGAQAPKRRFLPFKLSNAADSTLVVTPRTTAQEFADLLKAGTPSKTTISVRIETEDSPPKPLDERLR